jgi:oligoendopeptidase F
MNNFENRNEIDDKYKWNLSPIYENLNEWEKDFEFVEKSIKKYSEYEGKISESVKILQKVLKFDEYLDLKLNRLHLYAFLAKDVDLSLTENQSRERRMHSLWAKVASASSFIIPEILEIDQSKIYSWMAENEDLRTYKHFFDNLFRQREFSLPKEQEKLLALSSPALSSIQNTFSLTFIYINSSIINCHINRFNIK